MATTMRADALRNRQRILDAAREASTELGEDAQIDDIARRAGLGVGTLYRDFTTKDALVGELLRLKLVRIRGAGTSQSRGGERPLGGVEGGLRDQADVMRGDAAHQSMPFAATQDASSSPLPRSWSSGMPGRVVIARAKEAGVLRQDSRWTASHDDVRARKHDGRRPRGVMRSTGIASWTCFSRGAYQAELQSPPPCEA